MEQDIKTQLLTKRPIDLLFQLSVPAVIGMTVIGLYPLMDGVVVAFEAVAEAVENEEDDGFDELAHDMRRAGNWDGALYSGLSGN